LNRASLRRAADEGTPVMATINDIIAPERDEKHVAQMESKYRGLLEAAPGAMVVVNQDGEIMLLNAQAEQQFGYHQDELLGQKVENTIPEGLAERLVSDGARTPTEAEKGSTFYFSLPEGDGK
jgi:PAS domain S-box-containing protein